MHIIKVKGYIISLEDDKMVINARNIDKIKNILATYGTVDFVPFVGKEGVKIKYGLMDSIANIHGVTSKEYITANYNDGNIVVEAKVRKNKFKNSTSLSLLCQRIVVE